MSQIIYRDSFPDSAGDERLSGYTYTPSVAPSTLGDGPVQSVEVCHTRRLIWSRPLIVVYHSSSPLLSVVLAMDFGQPSIHRPPAPTLRLVSRL